MSFKNIQLTLVAFIAIFLLGGCSTTKITTKQDVKFREYDNTNHIVGEKNIATKKLIYIEEVNNKVSKKVTFYIDKLPFNKKFNLCKNTSYNCNSYISVVEDRYPNNDIVGAFNLKMISGFRKVGDSFFPDDYSSNSPYTNFKDVNVRGNQDKEIKTYWTFN